MPRTVAIAGFGAIGKVLARRLTDGSMPDFELAVIGARDAAKTGAEAERVLKRPVPVVESTKLAGKADILLECVPTGAFRGVVEPALAAGMTVITVSGAALLEHMDLEQVARKGGGQLILATGAIVGLDAIRAARLGRIESVKMVTRKPPKSLATAKQVVEDGKDLFKLTAPELLFKGTAREGARRFPANVNVAAAIALAGAGPDRTELEIWTDPAVERNTHRVVVEADTARIEVAIANVPSDENPGTGRITALSMLAALERLASPIVYGT
jgi:aspartate dehydrogenase